MYFSVITDKGQRKYLTQAEREQFLNKSKEMKLEIYTFCRLLAETGCRISEALNLRREHIDVAEKMVSIETLKKRRAGTFRRVPVSDATLLALISSYANNNNGNVEGHGRLWNWSRMTGYRYVCNVMKKANIKGDCASPKGLRHGFAVAALQSGAPLNLVQRWLGHSHWNTTAIYADMIDNEERFFAEKIWFAQNQDAHL
ncbi:tyrosine-type recombinase/integrase [Brucella gallinifaecis]|uniref:Site-specific integrase n=1 Tax=Brucella gallinifaecis TaxID=215590 RepID=A0A502BQJ7_9HYPH|nr:site-specific integrase [Brucella gallinifaecis]TPF75418.1 site-specific integrase [Brucella gallinifaecis]